MNSHPAQGELQRRYATARSVWATSQSIRDAAALLSWSEREYCEAYVQRNYGPITWTGSSTTDAPPLDTERAYREAKP